MCKFHAMNMFSYNDFHELDDYGNKHTAMYKFEGNIVSNKT